MPNTLRVVGATSFFPNSQLEHRLPSDQPFESSREGLDLQSNTKNPHTHTLHTPPNKKTCKIFSGQTVKQHTHHHSPPLPLRRSAPRLGAAAQGVRHEFAAACDGGQVRLDHLPGQGSAVCGTDPADARQGLQGRPAALAVGCSGGRNTGGRARFST